MMITIYWGHLWAETNSLMRITAPSTSPPDEITLAWFVYPEKKWSITFRKALLSWKAKGILRQLSKDLFQKTMPNGEKILRSCVICSFVIKKLYSFCWRLFADSVADKASKFDSLSDVVETEPENT